ncbi:COR domain-containing protein [Symbioplanes lichenis]|uniref:COR domain-containing protein n=1 Tax=Symbioplanes lichenis TaxID=1629072 RepID=UPI002738DCF9|nr:COR domain-containing protein [Actinoplanes lichenis]
MRKPTGGRTSGDDRDWQRIPDGSTVLPGAAQWSPVRPPGVFSLDDIERARRDGYLRFSGSGLTSLPAEISQLGDLGRLYLVHNELVVLPPGIGHLVNLTELDVRSNRLNTLPAEIGRLSSLEELYLDDNAITTLPVEIGDLGELRNLDLEGNKLRKLPPALFKLRKLEQLDLRNNGLTELPGEIGRLTNLRRLYLSHNALSEIPPEIGQLTRLEKLELDHNHISALPREIIQILTRPITFTMENNPLQEPYPDLIARGWTAVSAYLKSLEDAIPQYEAKVLVVGEGNVGKTSLIASLRSESFVANRDTTHGLEIQPLTLQHPDLEVKITVRTWDFGGQEVYRITHPFFFSRRALYIVVWNPRDGQEQNEVEAWLQRIRLRVGLEARAVIVSTHGDERHAEIDYEHLKRTFPGMLAGHFTIDNRSGRGIDSLREAMARESAALPQMGRMLSPRWISARDEILSQYRERPQISFDQFVETCRYHGLDTDEISTLSELMHDLGHIIHYGDYEGLRDIVVLNPEWLTKAIGFVLEDGPTRSSAGVLAHRRLYEIWNEKMPEGYETRHYPYFLRLMEQFDICYRLSEGPDPLSLVAQLVPHARPRLPWSFDTPLFPGLRRIRVVCKLNEPALGLVSWLTVRHHPSSVGMHWRRGVFLRNPISAYASEALIELDSDRRLLIEVRAPSPDMFFNVIIDSVQLLLHLRWPGLHYSLVIPCPTAGCTGEFPLDNLLRRRRNQRSRRDCMECDGEFDIAELLTGFSAVEPELHSAINRLVYRIDDMSQAVEKIEAGVDRIEVLATESTHFLRRVIKTLSTEVTDCPRIFTLAPPPRASVLDRLRLTTDLVLLTLWCEHPGEWHPWHEASYELRQEKEWLGHISPYIDFLLKALRLVVPVTAAVAGVVLPKPDLDDINAELQLMKVVAERLPAQVDRPERESEVTENNLTMAEGAALRAFRALLFRQDPSQHFGGLRRVQAPSGEFLWVCPRHYQEYDPGLPTVLDLRPMSGNHDLHGPPELSPGSSH